MSLVQGAHQETNRCKGARDIILAGIQQAGRWLVAVILLIMPFIASGFFLIEIFATTLILGTIALSLMFSQAMAAWSA
jgi:branched-chain amino acid transport system permease protein